MKRSTLLLVLLALVPATALAHGVSGADQEFLEQSVGRQWGAFAYLGAKHMVTGYDHLLFLVGVLFFLRGMRDVALYVSLFAVGHSVTLLYGALSGTQVDPYLVDAVIGLSVAYKGFDNLGLIERWVGRQPDTRAAVLLFGLVHGFGLATKLQDYALDREHLVGNLIAFNVGVEGGQFAALAVILVGLRTWRRTPSFERHARAANIALVVAGFVLTAYQLHGYAHAHAHEAAPPEPAAVPQEFELRTDELAIELGPREGLEVKVAMREGDELVYTWETDGGSVFFDFHGEEDDAAKGEFTSYDKGQAKRFEGALQAPFDGVHGWYWKNLRSAPTTVRLTTTGVYRDLGPVQ